MNGIFIVLLAYLLGAVPFGYVITRLLTGRDIRTMGSGNIGATNVSRSVSRFWGRIVLLLDALKGLIPPVLAGLFHFELKVIVLSGLISVLGHMFPVYIGFKGGKGVATGLGALIGIGIFYKPVLLALCVFVGVWFVVHRLTGFVSLASILGAFSFAIYGLLRFEEIWLKMFALVLGLIVVIRHRSNILKLIKGKESKASL